MSDVLAIVWKEWRETLGVRGLRGKSGIALNLLVFGLVLPLQTGRAWVESPTLLLAWAWVPAFLVATVIADAFAGERERHTLETLLATRLTDRAILFGKMIAAIAYAGGVTAISLLLGVIAVNIAYSHGNPIFYSLLTVFAMLVIGCLAAVFVAVVGVFISLRTSTVRQATQVLGGTIMLALLAPMIVLRTAPPSWKASLLSITPTPGLLVLSAALLLALVDIGALALLVRRFQRSRLITA